MLFRNRRREEQRERNATNQNERHDAEAADNFYQAADDAIQRALSGNSQVFNAAVEQEVGE